MKERAQSRKVFSARRDFRVELLESRLLLTAASLDEGSSAVATLEDPTEYVEADHVDNAELLQPAFPGAEGFGANSVGGRGGEVYEVTHLGDDGSGSLRQCIEASGPRTCVFRVGGTIEVESTMKVNDPFITIAGQTAPGGGITLRNHDSFGGAPVYLGTHDIIIRYVRFRPENPGDDSGNLDALGSTGAISNVIIDHSSLSWSTDELSISWYDSHDVTFQWNIFSEPLNCATHNGGECHGMGLLLGDSGSSNVSVHHNLFAHVWYRSL